MLSIAIVPNGAFGSSFDSEGAYPLPTPIFNSMLNVVPSLISVM